MSTRPYVEHVHSNLKSPRPNGDAWGIELGPKTLLVGSNTSHKSSVVQSIELALAGSADDVIGRSIVSDAALLLTLAPGDELGVTARLSDGSTANYNARREDGKVKRPQHDGPGTNSLVHRSVAAALSGSATTARKAFLEWSCDDVTRDDVLLSLPEELHNKYADIAKHRGKNLDETKTLIEVLNYANSRARELSKEIKGAEIVLESIGDTLDAKPSDKDLDKLRFAVAEAREILDVSIAQSNGGLTLEDKNKKIAELTEKRDAWIDYKAQAEFSIRDLKSQLPHKGENVDGAIAIVDVAVKHELAVCPVCSSRVGLDHLKNCQSFYQEQSNTWESQSRQLLESIKAAEERSKGCDNNIVALDHELREIEDTPLTKVDSRVLPVRDAQDRLEVAMTALRKTETINDRWSDLIGAQERIQSFRVDQENYRALRIACERSIGFLLGEKARTFSELVQRFLPDAWKFKIELMDGDREVFRMGFVRHGKLHCALSGAEWATVITAVSMAVTSKMAKDKPAVLVPYDRAWDTRTLSAVMRGFLSFDGQVVIASTVRPMGRPPKGWTIIDMDEVSKSWVEGEKKVEEKAKPKKAKKKPERRKVRNEGGLSVISRSARKLQEMGYAISDVLTMSKETAQHLISNNIQPELVEIQSDGGFKIIKADNVLPISLPPSP
ncbi:MAG: hypothetical protein GOVbin2277_70 [Prokaryotic dsDNA virus sp.]|nr:MAG: hypothetical protein GOVbin2277_70 [Prokaryotic dsDNA virus sp.]